MEAATFRALHFMMLKYDLSKNPGRWRLGAVWVHDAVGEVVYTAPKRELVDDLVVAALEQLNYSSPNSVIRAALAHINLMMIHPFSDGNGRMARAVQSFVLASDGVLAPEFSSIEEYLGRNTPAYYQVLADTGQGVWNPHRDTLPWVRFCLQAHVQQATTTLHRIHETEALWDHCEQLASAAKLPDRCVGALNDAARGRRLQRIAYIRIVVSAAGETISEDTATHDLRALTVAGFLTIEGEKRGGTYMASPKLREAWADVRRQRPPS